MTRAVSLELESDPPKGKTKAKRDPPVNPMPTRGSKGNDPYPRLPLPLPRPSLTTPKEEAKPRSAGTLVKVRQRTDTRLDAGVWMNKRLFYEVWRSMARESGAGLVKISRLGEFVFVHGCGCG